MKSAVLTRSLNTKLSIFSPVLLRSTASATERREDTKRDLIDMSNQISKSERVHGLTCESPQCQGKHSSMRTIFQRDSLPNFGHDCGKTWEICGKPVEFTWNC
jgi:hypothetical protein